MNIIMTSTQTKCIIKEYSRITFFLNLKREYSGCFVCRTGIEKIVYKITFICVKIFVVDCKLDSKE